MKKSTTLLASLAVVAIAFLSYTFLYAGSEEPTVTDQTEQVTTDSKKYDCGSKAYKSSDWAKCATKMASCSDKKECTSEKKASCSSKEYKEKSRCSYSDREATEVEATTEKEEAEFEFN